jgi:predicted metal-dependent hydrolase
MTVALSSPADTDALAVRVRRSARRHKTVAWKLVGDTIVLSVPADLTDAELDRWVGEARRRTARRLSADRVDLPARARVLAERYALPLPISITWADMSSRWGSCTPSTRAVRLSRALARFPDWVLDVVIVHELAHLVHANHSAAFWALVHRHPLAERAKGYLIAKSGDPEGGFD